MYVYYLFVTTVGRCCLSVFCRTTYYLMYMSLVLYVYCLFVTMGGRCKSLCFP